MDSASVLQSSPGVYNSSFLRSNSSILPTNGPNSVKFAARLRPSTKYCASVSYSRSGYWRGAPSRRRHVVRASLSSESSEPASPMAPLKLESPVGQFLSQILVNHPHLLCAAVEQQLEQLQTDHDAEDKQQKPSATGTELVLYRRIAEVKANEREKALEEILYALVVQRFMDARVSLIPSISPTSSDPSGHLDSWPSQDDELRQLHSPEAYEMIQNHLSLILGNRVAESTSIAEISKIKVGQVYAASVMYGYFLKRVDQRFQLEKTMKTLPSASVEDDFNVQKPVVAKDGVGYVQSEDVVQPSRLRLYVMSFDGETLQRYATIRSREAVSIIEKHTEALFGRPEIVLTPEGTVGPSRDELIKISFGGLKRLVLEAVTFGSFLWDVENYADSRYHFVLN